MVFPPAALVSLSLIPSILLVFPLTGDVASPHAAQSENHARNAAFAFQLTTN
jgi:hypothetical protein